MSSDDKIYDYAVIGGGLGGIISCFILLKKYTDCSILWIDQDGFKCGDLSKYSCVYANTPMKKMSRFFKELVPYYQDCLTLCSKYDIDCNYCILSDFVDELKNLTRILRNNIHITSVVQAIDTIDNTDKESNLIILTTENKPSYKTKKVVMATGCSPKTLDIGLPIIDLYKALNKCMLRELQYQNKKIIVFGNRHSGILVLKNLYELGYKYITNVVRSDIKIPQYIEEDDRELYDQIGIRGFTLQWAQEHLVPENKTNIHIIKEQENKEEYDQALREAQYVIYAIGLEQRNAITIKYKNKVDHGQKCYANIDYNAKTGIIDDNIYGMGVAFLHYFIYKDVYECEAGMFEFYEQGMRIL